MRGRKRPNFPLSLIVWEEKLWCHRCAITNITHMCSRKKLSCPKWMNEQHEVYFLAPGFPLLCNSFCFSSSSSSFFSLKTWTQQELKYENPVILTGWSCLQVHLFILLMRLIFICTDRLSIGGNGHLLVLPGDFLCNSWFRRNDHTDVSYNQIRYMVRMWGVFIIIASSLLVISEDWMLFSFKRRYGSSLLNTFSYLESHVFVSV